MMLQITAEQYGMYCSVGHQYHHYKSLSGKLMCCSLLSLEGVLIAELPATSSSTKQTGLKQGVSGVCTYSSRCEHSCDKLGYMYISTVAVIADAADTLGHEHCILNSVASSLD